MDDTQRPVLHQVNLIARDWQATLDFYRLLGIDVSDGGEYPPGSGARHASVELSLGTMQLEWDSRAMANQYAPDAGESPIRGPIIGLAYPSSGAVDQAHARVVAAGHASRQAPYDAFWGARYAIVEDPDGVPVGLMGPRER